MVNVKPKVMAVAAAIAMLMVFAVPVSATSVSVNVNTAKHTADWHSQTGFYLNFTYPETSIASSTLNGTHGNLSIVVAEHSSFSAEASASLNGTIQTVYRHAYVSSLSLYYNATWSANRTVLSVEVQSALNMQVEGIGNGSANAVNMSWKDFNFTGSINVTTSTSGTMDINSPDSTIVYAKMVSTFTASQKRLSPLHMLDYSALSRQLSHWKRTYDSSGDRTVYSYNAGVTLNRSYNLSFTSLTGITQNYTLSVYLDPSAQVITSGNTYAVGNTLYARPGTGQGAITYIIAGVAVVALAAGLGAVMLRRRRNKS